MVPRSYLHVGGDFDGESGVIRVFLELNWNFTYEVARKAAIILRIYVPLIVVSSNPGVSIKTTRQPSKLKSPVGCAVFVQHRSPPPTPRLDLLARLTNYVIHGQTRGDASRASSTIHRQPGERGHDLGRKRTGWVDRSVRPSSCMQN